MGTWFYPSQVISISPILYFPECWILIAAEKWQNFSLKNGIISALGQKKSQKCPPLTPSHHKFIYTHELAAVQYCMYKVPKRITIYHWNKYNYIYMKGDGSTCVEVDVSAVVVLYF